MDTDELIDRLNTLLMHLLAAVIRHTGVDARDEYHARCAIFRIVTEPDTNADDCAIQRETFARVGRTVFGDRNALPVE